MENEQIYISENKKVYLVFFTDGFTISYKDIEWNYANPIKSVFIENLLKYIDIYKDYDKNYVLNPIPHSAFISVRMDDNKIVIGSDVLCDLEDSLLYLLNRLYE